jgi:cytochrome c5
MSHKKVTNNNIMIKFFILSVMVTLLMGISVVSCLHDPPDISAIDQVCFKNDILPVFQNSCGVSGCHSSSGGESGQAFTSYSEIMRAIEPFNASKSKAYQAMLGKPFTMMPPSGPLPKETRTKIWLWIQQGAPETTCGSDGTVTGVTYTCFNRDILPVLSNSCAITGCHNASSSKAGIVTTSYQTLMNSNIIKSGNPGSSGLYQVMTAPAGSENVMPPKPYALIAKAVTDSIYKWIQRGAKNEVCAAKCDTTGNITYTGHIQPVIQTYCLSCHSGTTPSGNLKLTTYTELSNATKTGKLLSTIKRLQGVSAMPPSTSLSTCDIRKFELWKSQNYLQ